MLTLAQRSSNRRSRRTCPTLCKHERKHSDTKTDSGCRPTRGSNDRASNSTENARKQVSISQQLNAAAIKQQERLRSKVTFFRCGKPGYIVEIQADAKIVVVERSCDKILLSKLNAYGLGGAVGTWFKSYLSDRSQKCYVNGHLSNNRTLLCGIPQGTILGPLLFLLYINDLPNCLEHSQARMYADDTNLTFASNNIDDINYYLNQDLANVNKWLIAHRLTLNQSKTEFMLIGSRQRIATFQTVPCLEIDGVLIDKVSQAKSLGVYLDENLSGIFRLMN